jgi:predicted Zn-dependent protease
MSIGASIFLIASGAIVRYALTFDIEGVDREALGLILMIAGAIGLAMSILYHVLWRDDQRRREQAYYDQYQQPQPPPAAPDDRTRRLR